MNHSIHRDHFRPSARTVLPPAPAQPLSVLVVDDNKDVADSLAMLIQVLGHHVTQAYDGETALVAAETTKPDVVFLDLSMPGTDGFDVASQLAASATSPDLRLVAVTGHSDREHLHAATQAGFTDYLVKPYVADEIIRILSRPAQLVAA